jgi:hypothetical protein
MTDEALHVSETDPLPGVPVKAGTAPGTAIGTPLTMVDGTEFPAVESVVTRT